MNSAKQLKSQWTNPEFKKDFISQVEAECPDFLREIPDFEKALDALAIVPFDSPGLSTPKDVLTFVEALIKSGIAIQVRIVSYPNSMNLVIQNWISVWIIIFHHPTTEKYNAANSTTPRSKEAWSLSLEIRGLEKRPS